MGKITKRALRDDLRGGGAGEADGGVRIYLPHNHREDLPVKIVELPVIDVEPEQPAAE